VDAVAAATILAEVGIDMAVFGTAKRLAAWAGVCPGNRESAGKAAATRKGNPHLKAALFTAAASAVRKKGSYCKAKYYRLKARQARADGDRPQDPGRGVPDAVPERELPGFGRGVPRPSGRETRDLAPGRAAQRAGIQCRAQTQGGGLILPLAPSSKHQQEARSGIFGAAACTPYRRGDEIGEPPVWITAGWRIARHYDPRDKGSVYDVKRGGRSENMACISHCTV
jgi:Transposase IS116/IS110/IS902 family